MKKDISLSLPVFITKQGRRFVAYTPALDISTSGTSEKDAKKKFGELVSLFLEEILEAGTVDDVLSELGWRKQEKKWTPPKVVSSHYVAFPIPVLT